MFITVKKCIRILPAHYLDTIETDEFVSSVHGYINTIRIYPTPPLGQDMTQGQFLSEV